MTPMDRNRIGWQDPIGDWSVTIDGILVPNDTMLQPDGKKYVARVQPICLGKHYTCEGTPEQAVRAIDWARQAQIESSIAHFTRKLCHTCEARFQTHISVFERKVLYARDYKLGPILGLGIDDRAGSGLIRP